MPTGWRNCCPRSGQEAAALATGASPKPILVKVAPDLSDHALGEVLEVCADHGIAGLIATNTTLSRQGLTATDRATLGDEGGGLSGKPLTTRAIEVVRFITGRSGLPVIGVGGVFRTPTPSGWRMLGRVCPAVHGFDLSRAGVGPVLRASAAVRSEGNMKRFGARLREAIRERGPLCVGIDPHPSLLAAWGLDDSVDGLARFADTVVEAVGGRVAAVKPQSAFFERFGSSGVADS